MDSLKEQRIAMKFCVLVILDKKLRLYLNDQADWFFDRRSSDMAQISQRRVKSSILRSKSRNKTQLIFGKLPNGQTSICAHQGVDFVNVWVVS